MIFAAVVRRELLSLLRKPGVYLLLLLFVSAAVIVSWSTYSEIEPLRIVDVSRMAAVGNEWLASLTLTLVIGACLVIPGVAGSAVAVEHDQETYDLLFLTCARPGAILVAKLAASTALFLFAIAAVMPVAAVAMFLPGVDIADFMSRMLHVLILVLVLGAFGILCSALIRRSFAAILVAYVVCLMAVYGAAYMVAIAVNYVLGDEMPEDLLFPYFAAPAILPFEEALTVADRFWAVFVGVHMIVVPLVLARLFLHRASQRPALAAPVIIDDAAQLDTRRKKFPYYLFDPARRRELMPDGVNPMLLRELRWGLFGRAHIIIRVAYISLSLGVVSAAGLIYAAPEIAGDFTRIVRILALIDVAIAPLVIPALVCNVVTKERETGNLDMLRATLLTPREIVFGKWLACCLSSVPFLIPLVAANLFVAVASVFADGRGMGYFAAGAAWLVLAALSAASVAFLGSALADRTATAVVLSYLLVLSIHLIAPATLYTIWYWTTGDDRIAFVPFILLSPFFACLSILYPEFFGAAQTYIAASMAGGVFLQALTALAAVGLAGWAFNRRGLRAAMG